MGKQFFITRTWVVDAETKEQAREEFENDTKRVHEVDLTIKEAEVES